MGTMETERCVVEEVVAAVAEKRGKSPHELDNSLGFTLDADALEGLVASMESGRVQFTFADCEVTVTHDNRVSVRNNATACSD